MNRKTAAAWIGAFVLFGFAIVAVVLILLGTGRLGRDTLSFRLYFDQSVRGLKPGATVAFKGVKIGKVAHVRVLINRDTLTAVIPVTIELDPEQIKGIGAPALTTTEGHYEFTSKLIEKGLRARLSLDNFLTGSLYINLDFYPDTKAQYHRSIQESDVPEIPTIPSSLEELSRAIENLPLDEVVRHMSELLEHANELLGTEGTDSFFSESRTVIEEARLTLSEMRNLIVDVDQAVEPTANELRESIQSAERAFQEAEYAFSSLRNVASADGPARHDLHQALDAVQEAARSVASLSEYLERHPEALLYGKDR